MILTKFYFQNQINDGHIKMAAWNLYNCTNADSASPYSGTVVFLANIQPLCRQEILLLFMLGHSF
jgi:hypothetical protein